MLALRFDIDSNEGLVRRTPPLLRLLGECGVPATFFCVMGRDPNLLEVLRFRILGGGGTRAALPIRDRGGLPYLARTLLFPRAVGRGNPQILRQIADAGHEVQIHGWSHIRWQRNFERTDPREQLEMARRAYYEVFGCFPEGFAAPGGMWDERVLDALDDLEFDFAADLPGPRPFRLEGRNHLQIPQGNPTASIVELRTRGLSDEQIIDYFREQIESHQEFYCISDHPDNLFDRELKVLRAVCRTMLESGREILTHRQIHARYRATTPSGVI